MTSEQRNGNGGKWEALWVWATRALIGVLTWIALTMWADLRDVGEDVTDLSTAIAVQTQRVNEHDRRLTSVEGRVYARQGDD